MSFTHVLYYPRIEIRNDSWIKNAALYWEKISTIVPESVDKPYKSPTSLALQEEEILVPLVVRPEMEELSEIAKAFRAYYESPESMPSGKRTRIYDAKIEHKLKDWLVSSGRASRRGEFLYLDRRMAYSYMTILASRLAENLGLGLLTDQQFFEPLANLVRRRDAGYLRLETMQRRSYHWRTNLKDENKVRKLMNSMKLGEAAMAQLTLQAIEISPDTPVEKILDFRRRRRTELARFREEMGKLASKFGEEYTSVEAFQQRMQDTFVNQVEPALDDLKSSMKADRLNFLLTALKTTAFTTSLSILPADMLGTALGPRAETVALLAGAAFSIAANLVTYQLYKEKALRANPYSYVLLAQKELRKRPRKNT